MPIRFRQGQIAALLDHLRLRPARKGSGTWIGVGRDGKPLRCYFHFHSDSTPVATGTASAIARQLGFGDVAAMKEYVDRHI